jgi:integrase
MPRPRLKSNTGLPARWRFKNGAYRYQVPRGLESQWDGKREFTLGKTLPEAYKVWAARVASPTKVTTVGDLLDRYLLEVVPNKKPATRSSDMRVVPIIKKRFGHFAVEPGPTSVEPHHIYEYVSKNKGRLTRAHREMAVLSHALTWAVQWGIIKKHPFLREVRFERDLQPKRKKRYVEDWEIVEALSLKPYRKRGSVLMCQAWIRLKLSNIGLRATDMMRLKVSDANAEGFTVQPSKTENTTERVQFFKWTPDRKRAWDMALAARPLDIAPYLFCNKHGESYFDEETGSASGFESIWQRFMTRVLKETKVKVRFAERYLRSKVGSDAESLERAQRILGHADRKVTQTFYRLKPDVIE